MQAMKAKKNNTKKWCIFSVLILSMCAALYFLLKNPWRNDTSDAKLLTKKNAYFVPIKINDRSPGDIPYLEVKIEDKTIIAELDLGYEGDVCLPSEIIQGLNAKQFLRSRPNYGLTGKIYKSDVYEVAQVHIENMTFFPIKAEEVNQEFENDIKLGEKKEPIECTLGRVGWCLFHNFNLLIDCEHSTLALCDSLETLKKQGYPVDYFTSTPLLLDRGFIEFEATTGTNVLRCLLDTGSTWNMLNKDLENSCNNHMIFTPENVDQYSILNPENKNIMVFDSKDIRELSVFNIGGKEFGPMTFNRIKSPMAIDAIIGMEFFNSTLIFIDFSNSKIYFYEYPEQEEKDFALTS